MRPRRNRFAALPTRQPTRRPRPIRQKVGLINQAIPHYDIVAEATVDISNAGFDIQFDAWHDREELELLLADLTEMAVYAQSLYQASEQLLPIVEKLIALTPED